MALSLYLKEVVLAQKNWDLIICLSCALLMKQVPVERDIIVLNGPFLVRNLEPRTAIYGKVDTML